MADPTPEVRTLTLVTKPTLTIDSPDTTTIEVIAAAIGAKGTRVNIKSSFEDDGSTPVILPIEPASGYTLGEVQKYQVVPPQPISVGGDPARPYTLKMRVEAENLLAPADQVQATFDIIFAPSSDHVTGLAPSVYINRTQTLLTLTSQSTAPDGPKTVVTTNYVATLVVNDPVPFQVVCRVLGPPASLGTGAITVVTGDTPPALPSYVTFDGVSKVDDTVNVFGPRSGGSFRNSSVTHVLHAKIRAVDQANLDNVFVAVLTLTIIASNVLTGLDVLVRRNKEIFNILDLPADLRGRILEAGDKDTVEVLLRPRGQLGNQAYLRGLFEPRNDAVQTSLNLAPITDVLTFSDTGQLNPGDPVGAIGIFGIDKKAPLIPAMPAAQFRALYSDQINIIADATSTLNIYNSFAANFIGPGLCIAVPEDVTSVSLLYVNSRNPDDILPLQAGTDVNGTITGAGTLDDPFIVPVDKPEQLQVFAVAEQSRADTFAWVQTGYAFNENPIDVLYPSVPEGWSRGFTRTQKVNILPHPAAPGTPSLRPPRGDELILISGGTPVGDPGVDVGYSNKIRLYARAQGVANEFNVKEVTVFIRVADPSVL